MADLPLGPTLPLMKELATDWRHAYSWDRAAAVINSCAPFPRRAPAPAMLAPHLTASLVLDSSITKSRSKISISTLFTSDPRRPTRSP